ncbi:hypothetical protein [Kaistia sp. MMO-174]|uniref:hypothetical protein n=1 Tax=Kaistia sp. MMO-174 TaxID=3081256 RepID=UPI003016F504
MRVRFLADFDWSPAERGGRVTIAYKAGMTLSVTRACAAEAIAVGKAEVAKKENPDERR